MQTTKNILAQTNQTTIQLPGITKEKDMVKHVTIILFCLPYFVKHFLGHLFFLFFRNLLFALFTINHSKSKMQ